MNEPIKDLFHWDDEVVQDILNTYPVQVQDRLEDLHPTSTVIYHAIDQITKTRQAAGREATASPTLREITKYIARNFGVEMQWSNVSNRHLPGLLDKGLVRRETTPTGDTAPRGIIRVEPNELPEYGTSPPSVGDETSGGPPEEGMWDDFQRPTVFNIEENGSLV